MKGFIFLAIIAMPVLAIIIAWWLERQVERKEKESEKRYLLLILLDLDGDIYCQTIDRLDKSYLNIGHEIKYIKNVIDKIDRGRYCERKNYTKF